jgi:hypothetical protein
MALLTKKDFAAKTGQTTKTLSTYIGRGKVKAEDNGLIDTNNELNKSFMIIHSGKEAKERKARANTLNAIPQPQIPREETWIDPDGLEDNEFDENGIPALHVSEKAYKHYLSLKTKASEELERLKIEKLKGDVVPTQPIETLVFQFKQYTLTQQKIAYESFLNEIAHKYSITGEDMAYYRSFFIKSLNNAVLSATDLFVKDLGTTLGQYSVKKGA